MVSLFYFRFYAAQGVILPLFALFCFLFMIVGLLGDLLAGKHTKGFRPEFLLIGTSLVYTSLLLMFLEGRLQPVGNLNEYFSSISLILLLLSVGVLVIALFYRYYVDRNKEDGVSFRYLKEPRKFEVETYRKQMYPELWIPLFVVSVCILFILTQRITPPELGISLLVFLSAGGFFVLFHMLKSKERVQIVLKSDCLIQTGKQSKEIPWKDIHSVVLFPKVFRKELCICFKEDDQIKEFYPLYNTMENKEDFLRSLKRFSKKHGFDFVV